MIATNPYFVSLSGIGFGFLVRPIKAGVVCFPSVGKKLFYELSMKKSVSTEKNLR